MSLNDVFGPFPGRPDHPDFAVLADIVLQQDGRSYDADFDYGSYLGQFIDPASLRHMCQQRAKLIVVGMGKNPALNARLVDSVAASMLDAFMVGYLFHQRRMLAMNDDED